MSDETEVDAEERPKRTRRTKAEIEADRAALAAAHASDTIPTADLIALLQDWQSRYNSCDDSERIIQRHLKIRFMREYDYETRSWIGPRFQYSAASTPERVSKRDVAKAIKVTKRGYGASSYGMQWLEKQITTKWGLDFKTYNDKYTITYTKTIDAKLLEEWGWEGREDADTIAGYLRQNYGINWRTDASLTVESDPQRAVDAAAKAAADAATKAAEQTAEVTEVTAVEEAKPDATSGLDITAAVTNQYDDDELIATDEQFETARQRIAQRVAQDEAERLAEAERRDCVVLTS